MTVCDFPLSWPIARYRFLFEVTSPMSLPDYAGSAIRGAFGHALRRIACMTHEPSCPECPLYRSCPYSLIFESPAPPAHELQRFNRIPNPYVIEAPLFGRRLLTEGEALSFSVVLFGRALHQLPLVIFSLQKAFERNVAHGTARLKAVWACGEHSEVQIYSEGAHAIAPHQQTVDIVPADECRSVKLTFKTHLRLQNNGKAYGPKDIPASAFLTALIRRASLLREFHADKFAFDFSQLKAMAESVESKKALIWQNWQRYSNRQHQGMHLGGVAGEWTFLDLPPELQYFLSIGQWIHVGKNASFGLGAYSLCLI